MEIPRDVTKRTNKGSVTVSGNKKHPDFCPTQQRDKTRHHGRDLYLRSMATGRTSAAKTKRFLKTAFQSMFPNRRGDAVFVAFGSTLIGTRRADLSEPHQYSSGRCRAAARLEEEK